MGMFDYIKYNGFEYQSKSTPHQALDNFEIRANELWVEEYELEWSDDPGMMFGGSFTKKNLSWKKCGEFSGDVVFYRSISNDNKREWEEFKALFENGKLIKIEEV